MWRTTLMRGWRPSLPPAAVGEPESTFALNAVLPLRATAHDGHASYYVSTHSSNLGQGGSLDVKVHEVQRHPRPLWLVRTAARTSNA